MYEEIKDYTGTRPRRYTLISGAKRDGDDPSVIAYCTSQPHPGFLTLGYIYQHQCFFKKCKHFRKLPENPFWSELQKEYVDQLRYRKSQKGMRMLEAQDALAKEKQVKLGQVIVAFSRRWIKERDLEEDLKIISATPFENSTRNYRLFYVSSFPSYDAPYYLDLTRALQRAFSVRIKLVHIKNPNGEWATIDEYNKRRKK